MRALGCIGCTVWRCLRLSVGFRVWNCSELNVRLFLSFGGFYG